MTLLEINIPKKINNIPNIFVKVKFSPSNRVEAIKTVGSSNVPIMAVLVGPIIGLPLANIKVHKQAPRNPNKMPWLSINTLKPSALKVVKGL